MNKNKQKKEKVPIEDLLGLGKSKEVTNAVELKRNLYKSQ